MACFGWRVVKCSSSTAAAKVGDLGEGGVPGQDQYDSAEEREQQQDEACEFAVHGTSKPGLRPSEDAE